MQLIDSPRDSFTQTMMNEMETEPVYSTNYMPMQEADKKVGAIYQEIKEQMEKEEKTLRTNKSELKGQLQDLVDTEKYLKIIEERNREIEKEKMEGRPEYEQEKREEKAIYANRQTDIKINQEYLDKLVK